jgi:hypothetical protein
MGLAAATTRQILNSPRFGSAWETLPKAQLERLHRALIYQLTHMPEGPREAVIMIFGEEVADIMEAHTSKLQSDEQASQRRRVGTQAHEWDNDDVFS